MFFTFCAPEALCLGVLCSCIHKVLMKDSLNTELRKHKHVFVVVVVVVVFQRILENTELQQG